ncbi:MAG: hypothetical protein WB998_09995 [Solirubrobacteraceae bacterium]
MLSGILFLLPALALSFVLFMRRYPGERTLVRLAAPHRRRARWARPRASVPRAARSFAVAVHGGLLIARSLAVRPPPAFVS